ncbi:DNA polymerase [Paenibacillus sinopodophylli]|uniref:DNA polymerase n=1 Tax=Paenibacillus sinopodophylli TaxID=1837342 RepID=UPI00110CC52E|nr:DNA polymerase [Paenibacillus sinopodophylli]
MKLGGLFGNMPQKTLAKALPAKPADSSQLLPLPGAALARAIAPKKRPGDFGVVWPTIPQQQVKDYKAILTQAELEAYADRCEALGLCSFDWETAASKAAREAFAAYKAEMETKIANLDGFPMDEKDAKERAALKKEYEAQLTTTREAYLMTPLDPHQSEVCTVSLAAAPHESRVVPIDHKAGRIFEPTLSREAARKLVMDTLDRRIFRNRKVVKIAVNLSFETKFAAKYGKYILLPVADPLVMWVRCLQVADPKRLNDLKKPATGWGLKPATKAVFGVNMGEFKELLAKYGVDFFDEIAADSGDGLVYSAEDADYGLQHYLYWKQIAIQIKDDRQGTNYDTWLHEIEMPFSRVIGLMEYNGMGWDNHLAQMKREEAWSIQTEAANEINQLSKEAVGMEISLGKTGKTNSVKYVLFNMMNLPKGKPTDKGGISLDEEALIDIKFMLENNLEDLTEEKLLSVKLPEGWESYLKDSPEWYELGKDQRAAVELRNRPPHPFKDVGLRMLELMGRYQKMNTLLSSHVDGREKWQNPVTGKIHASYTPWTDTSRLNSMKPNGQNVPRLENDELGVRNFYVAGPGKILFFIDFSGFELRILAWKSGDKVMIEIFCTGGDMHRKTGAAITNKPESEVTKQERTDAKPANFGMAYGGTEHALQKTIKTDYGQRKTLAECAVMVDGTKKAYPGVPVFQHEIAMQAREDGFVSTIYGYIRLLPDINSTNTYYRQSAGRQAANTPIQGTAADVMKKAQNEVYEETGRGTNLVFDATEKGMNPVDLAREFGEAPPILVHGKTDMEAQIHDEMIFEMDDDPDVVEAAWHWVQATMTKPPIEGFPVPIEAEASVGYAWGKKMSVEKWLEEKRAAQKGA